MSQPFIPGPTALFCAPLANNPQPLFLGFSERGVSIDLNPRYSPYVVDITGDEPLDYCLPPRAQVLMSGGSCKDASEITEGDLVRTAQWNVSRVTAVMARPYEGDMMALELPDRRVLRCTPEHPVLTPEGYVPAATLSAGSLAACHSLGGWAALAAVGREPYAGTVYNFDVAGDGSYVADGVGVHNCYQGTGCTIHASLNNWNEAVYAQISDYVITQETIRGVETFGDIGTLMGFESNAYQLWVPFPYQAKAAYASMPAGYRFPKAFLDRDSLPARGARPASLQLTWRAIRQIGNSDVNGRLGGTLTKLYDHDMSAIAGAIFNVNR